MVALLSSRLEVSRGFSEFYEHATPIMDERLQGLLILRYERGKLPNLPLYEKSTLAMSIMDVTSQMAGGADPPRRIALSAYPLVDIFDPLMSRNCQIDLICSFGSVKGYVLTHFGSDFERRHYFGPVELFEPYVDYDLPIWIERKKVDPSGTKRYGLVLQAAYFPYNQLAEHFAEFPVALAEDPLKRDRDGHQLHAETVYGLVKYCTDSTFNNNRPVDLSLELDWPPKPINDLMRYVEESERLVTRNIPNNSFDRAWLERNKHMVITDKSGSVVATAGYQGTADYENHRILVATDSAVIDRWRREHVGSHLRKYMNERESVRSINEGMRLIIVADFGNVEVADKYGKRTLGYGFASTTTNVRNAKSYWFELQMKE